METRSTAFACVRCNTHSRKPPRRTFRFMRQSETDAIPNGYIDSTNKRLTIAGVVMASEAADEFAPVAKKVRMIVSSPMEGAIDTASIFSRRLQVPVRKNPCLMERSLGKLPARLDESFFANLLRRDYYARGLTPLDEVEKEILTFLANCVSDPFLGTDTLFVTHSAKLLALINVIKGWDGRIVPICKPPGNCEIVTFAVGAGCRKCDGLLYEERAA